MCVLLYKYTCYKSYCCRINCTVPGRGAVSYNSNTYNNVTTLNTSQLRKKSAGGLFASFCWHISRKGRPFNKLLPRPGASVRSVLRGHHERYFGGLRRYHAVLNTAVVSAATPREPHKQRAEVCPFFPPERCTIFVDNIGMRSYLLSEDKTHTRYARRGWNCKFAACDVCGWPLKHARRSTAHSEHTPWGRGLTTGRV